MEMSEKEGKGGEGPIRKDNGKERIKERVTDIERKMELKERTDRERNIIIRELEMKKGRRRKAEGGRNA